MAFCVVIIFLDYDRLVHWIVAVLQKPLIESLVRHKALPAGKYRFIQYLCGAGLLLVPLLVFLVLRKADKAHAAVSLVSNSLGSSGRAVTKIFYQNTAVQNGSVVLALVFIAIKSLYYIWAWDLQYDEMWCYNYFTARPFYFTPFAYNNYPLFELSTHIFKGLPLPMKVNLRLPVLVTGLLSCVLVYACLRRYCRSHLAALGGLLVYAFMPVTTLYMLYARGVIFESFFAIAGIFSLLFWLRTDRRNWLVIFFLANGLGMYAMPTHIYFWALLCVLGAGTRLRTRKTIRPFIIANSLALVLSILLYLPVMLGSGLSFVVEAVTPRYTYSQIIPNIPAFIASYSSYFTGFKAGIVCMVVVTGVYLLTKKPTRDPVLLALIAILCLFPLLAYVVQRMVVPYRASGFVALALPLLFALTVQRGEKWVSARLLYPSILLSAAILLVASHRCHDLNWSRPRDREAMRLSYLFMNRDVRKLYDNSPNSGFFYFYPALEYYYGMEHRQLDFSVAATNSIRFKPFYPGDNYDCIIYPADAPVGPLPGQYKEVGADSVLKYKVLLREGRDLNNSPR